MNAYGSETDALDLFERDVVGRPVVKLGRAHSFADTHSFAVRSNKPPRTEVISNEQLNSFE